MSAADLFAEAASLDASGLHDAALRCLIQAAQQGEGRAFTQLGKRYLSGDRATLSPPSAVQLLHKAVEHGQGEAAHLLAVLHALGIHVAQDWNQCFNLLVAAAVLDWQEAQDELKLLSRHEKLAQRGGSGQAYWVELARGIDLAYWHAPAPVEMLCDAPRIGRIAQLVDKDVCSWIIARARNRLKPAMVYDSVQQKEIRHPTRSNSSAILGVTDTNVLLTLLQIRIAATMQVPLRQLEAPTVLHYKGQEEIRNHFDFIDPGSPHYAEQIRQRGDRIITFLVYLNDNYGEGETEFPEAGVKHKGTRGEGLFFVNVNQDGTPDLRTVHAGRPPSSGEKWIVTQFIRNKPTF
jgi:prolyl 4-hydroxylase